MDMSGRMPLRTVLGIAYYRVKRWKRWLFAGTAFASERSMGELPHLHMVHRTPLLRQLSNVEMWLQYNKVVNLKLASERLYGIVIKPGETFSYWKLIGRPTRRKGYLEGMILSRGRVTTGIGGGLCQLSNLIYWMTLHTPLTVTERHRHGYDVFPDSGRTQPFGSGATCYYNYIDLQIENRTAADFQLIVRVTGSHLVGEWRSRQARVHHYEVYESNPHIKQEYPIGYTRHNELRRRVYTLDGELVADESVAENHAYMMYEPLLAEGTSFDGN